MIVSRHVLRDILVIFLMASILHNASGAAVGTGHDGNEDSGGAEDPTTAQSPSLVDRMSSVMNSVKQQATETLDSAGHAPAPVLNRLQGGGPRYNTENKLLGANALDRLQETKGRTVAAAKRVMDETVHKLQSTVDDIRRTVSGDDWGDVGGDKKISNALDSLFRAVGSESKAMFKYASDALNETAERAKAAVERTQTRRPPQ
ncbi:uncharacterized protein LOC112689644 [Sipha flava]|uniref:Uncharacterized protein LOC112689644 n=1 Tax=Sipha flava TaxID=143950 RepID=A0A8B8G914_9HEMI|nr:uncharacterized protein LOC112689644 [Sipha flava]